MSLIEHLKSVTFGVPKGEILVSGPGYFAVVRVDDEGQKGLEQAVEVLKADRLVSAAYAKTDPFIVAIDPTLILGMERKTEQTATEAD